MPGRDPLSMLTAEQRAQASAVCEQAGVSDPVLLDNCVVDVACTGDESYADKHAALPAPQEALDLLIPIFMDGWQQQGDPAHGNWEVSADGRSVVQTRNGDPSFFVSTQRYQGVSIRGSFQSSDSDDDIMGFVFGYRAPIEEEGHGADEYDTFLLSWKQSTQSHGGYTAQEGLTLAHVDGTVADIAPPFWGHEPSDVYNVLATEYGPDTGWQRHTEHQFVLRYTSERIEVEIDGRKIFDISQSDAGVAFEPGRFGFYNYSQASVTYGDFSVQQLSD
jgi:hypothetical protein